MKTFLKRSILGIMFGSFLALVTTFSVIYFGNREVLDAAMFVRNAGGSVLCGWLFAVASLLFENDKFSLAVKTALHFAFVSVFYFIIAFVTRWFPFTWSGFVIMLGIFVAFYLLIWLSFYMYFRKQAARLNDDLHKI